MPTSTSLTLVLGATGKTGSRVANRLLSRGLPVRTAARSGADAHFDWDDPETYAPALHGIKRVYLLGPVMRTDFADQPAVYGAVLRMLTETIASGHGSRPNSDVEKATGAAPVSFADFARRTAAAWAVDEAR
jgi:uncharacterized protein YbjT (DUF2867 family)